MLNFFSVLFHAKNSQWQILSLVLGLVLMQCIFLLLLTLQFTNSLTPLEQYGYGLLGSQMGWFGEFLNSPVLEKELLNELHQFSPFVQWQMFLLLWGVCLLGGGLGVIFSKIKGLLYLLGFIFLLLLIWGQMIFFYFWQWPVILFSLGLIGTFVIEFIYFSYLHRIEKKQIAEFFYPELSENFLEKIELNINSYLSHHQCLAQRLTGTVLFIRLHYLNKNLDCVEPNTLMELLGDYNTILINIVARYQGQITRGISDDLIISFGVPIARNSPEQIARDACRAADCALTLRRNLEQWRQQAMEHGLTDMRVRMGLYTGALMTGLLHTPQKSHYLVLGETVNLAMEIGDFNPQLDLQSGCRILIGDTTLTLLADRYETQYVGAISVNNKREMNVHRVTGRMLLLKPN